MEQLLKIITTRKTSKPRTVACSICEKEFETTHSQAKYCPETCKHIARKKDYARYTKTHKDIRQRYYLANRQEIYKKAKQYSMTAVGREVQKRADIKRREKDEEKVLARRKISDAIRLGKLERMPCSICGYKNAQAHHPDYSKPFLIAWLCKICHRREHANIKEREKNNGTEIKTDTNIQCNTGT